MLDEPKIEVTPKSIAEWMARILEQQNRLVQSSVAAQIRMKFGDEFVYRNQNRNWAINKDILTEFRKLTPDNIVWSRSRQEWRKRRPNDPEGRMVK